MQVNKAWAKEAKRFIWHSPDPRFLLSTSTTEDRVPEYAALVRHIIYDVYTGKHLQPKFWGYLPGFSTTRPLPTLPGLTSVECEPSSLSDRTIEHLSTIFVPTLEQLVIQDHAAYRSSGYSRSHSQLRGVSWFDIMTKNCLRLTSITLGSDLHIDSCSFERFLKNATHLKSVTLGYGTEHLLVDALAPVLKSTKASISYQSPANNTTIPSQLSKMHALQDLELNVGKVWLTSSDINQLKALTKLQLLGAFAEGGHADTVTGCSATAEELAEMIEAMPLLSELRMSIPCGFMESQKERLGDGWYIL